jgi:hypothetical protein
MFADTDRHLRKLSIRKMQFQVTQIDFDFTDSFDVENYDQDVIDEVLATIWEASDEEDLVDEITSATGYCVNSIDYRHVLK